MTEAEDRVPTYLWVEASLRRLMSQGLGVYVLARGNQTDGIVIQKINDMAGACILLIQQRDPMGRMGWHPALTEDKISEQEAQDYLLRAQRRDPDLWVIEIDDKTLNARL